MICPLKVIFSKLTMSLTLASWNMIFSVQDYSPIPNIQNIASTTWHHPAPNFHWHLPHISPILVLENIEINIPRCTSTDYSFLLVQKYSKLGVSCRIQNWDVLCKNIGQLQWRITHCVIYTVVHSKPPHNEMKCVLSIMHQQILVQGWIEKYSPLRRND